MRKSKRKGKEFFLFLFSSLWFFCFVLFCTVCVRVCVRWEESLNATCTHVQNRPIVCTRLCIFMENKIPMIYPNKYACNLFFFLSLSTLKKEENRSYAVRIHQHSDDANADAKAYVAWCYIFFLSAIAAYGFFLFFEYIYIKYIIFLFFSYYFTLFALSINISLWCLHLKLRQRTHTK